MEFALSAEQQQLQAVADRFLADRYPAERIAALSSASGVDPQGWAPLSDLGWFDPAFGMVERALVAEACGYALCPLPWLAALALAGPFAPEHPTAWAGKGFAARPAPSGGWTVSGSAPLVVDSAAAQSILVEAEAGIFQVATTAPGCVVRPVEGIDPLRRSAAVVCSDVPARRLAAPPESQPVAAATRLRRRALLVAEAVGVARRAYDMAVAHVKVREQFGRPVGSYQGVAFGVADCYVRIELARSLAYRAAWLVGEDEPAAGLAVATAVPVARHAAVANCEQAIQAVGGLGMTWEHPLHHWYRRALWFETDERGDRAYLAEVADALLPS